MKFIPRLGFDLATVRSDGITSCLSLWTLRLASVRTRYKEPFYSSINVTSFLFIRSVCIESWAPSDTKHRKIRDLEGNTHISGYALRTPTRNASITDGLTRVQPQECVDFNTGNCW
jgi:hypothetical protein